jgi:hypothetical protein
LLSLCTNTTETVADLQSDDKRTSEMVGRNTSVPFVDSVRIA